MMLKEGCKYVNSASDSSSASPISQSILFPLPGKQPPADACAYVIWLELQLDHVLCLVLYSCSYTYNYHHYNFFLLNKCFTDKINLKKKSSKYTSSFWCVLGTKFSAFALGGRGPGWAFSTASGHKMIALREKQHCTSATTKHYICTYVSEQVMSTLAY